MKKVIVIAAIDGAILSRAIMSKYYHSVSIGKKKGDIDGIKLELRKLTTEYLDKLFLIGIKLGKLSTTEVSDFFEEITRLDLPTKTNINGEIDESDEEEISTDVIQENDSKDKSETRILEQEAIRLSEKEFDILKIALLKYDDVTPRQIRILYFRYLLARNLLVQSYENRKAENIWQDESKLEILIELLISSSKNKTELNNMLNDCIKTENTIQKIKGIEISTSDYYEVLKVLDMVIAY